jgi:hypothetical protein
MAEAMEEQLPQTEMVEQVVLAAVVWEMTMDQVELALQELLAKEIAVELVMVLTSVLVAAEVQLLQDKAVQLEEVAEQETALTRLGHL